MPNTPEGPPRRQETRHSAPAVACVSCLAVSVLALLSGMLALAIYSRHGKVPQPFQTFAQIQQCSQNLTELTAALGRYHNKNAEYPASLGELYPDFLKSDSVLWCPSAMPRESGTSYNYTRPPASAHGRTVAIRCTRHGIREGRVVLEARLDGSIATRHEGITQVIRPGKAKKPAESGGAK